MRGSIDNIPNHKLYKLSSLVKYTPMILTIAYVVQTFVVRFNMSPTFALTLNYVFGFSMLPLLVLVYHSFTKYNNYVNKVCSVGNLFLCTTNFIYVLSDTKCLEILVHRLLSIEVCIIALVSIHLTIKRYVRDNKRTDFKNKSE